MSVVALTRLAARIGIEPAAIATLIGIASATIEDWRAAWQEHHLGASVRGRPARIAPPAERNAVIGALTLLGPAIPTLALRELFPWVARRELEDITRRFRGIARRKGELQHELRWLRPGAVWAMDATDPPSLVDGIYRSILVVRDLASGAQLLALPCLHNDEDTVLGALRSLFLEHGAPLILKSDNGSSFCSVRVREFLSQASVLLLLSPPATPRYNGACEAGIGVLKTRAHHEAVRHGRAGAWTSDDVEAARMLGSMAAEAAWIARKELTAGDRNALGNAVEVERRRIRGLHPDAPVATLERLAIAAATCSQGLLEVRRRRITPRIKSLRREKIS